jgi:peptidoglycan/LPS O-acetylase OafA/YrhL
LRYFQDHWTYLTRPGAYPGIDALRFVAISTVALYHFQFLPWGWVGVDVFFVLSGFLIGGALLDEGRERRLSFGRFYGHRALRILPLYYLFVLLSFLFKAHSRVDETTIPSVLASLTFMQTTGAYYFKWPVDPAYIPGGSWSLVVEETFYLIAPLFIWILTRITRNMWICAAVSGPDLLLRPNAMTRITMWLPTLLGLGTAAAVLAMITPGSAPAQEHRRRRRPRPGPPGRRSCLRRRPPV